MLKSPQRREALNDKNFINAEKQIIKLLERSEKLVDKFMELASKSQTNEDSLEENLEEMKEAIANVKTGQVTFAIKDTNIDGVEIYANQYMSLCEKEITACVPSKIDALKETLKGLVDEDSELITLICGEDVTEEEKEEAEAYIEDNFDAEVEVVDGLQPVYSFIVGVE